MNERIRELVAQFGPVARISNWGKVEWLDNIYPQLGDVMYADVDLQKFAELVVRECAYIIEAQDVDPSFKHRLSWAMKKHFGVDDD